MNSDIAGGSPGASEMASGSRAQHLSDLRLGIDIGGTKTAAVVLDANGRVMCSRVVPSGRGPQDVVARAAAVAQQAISDAGGASRLASAGACIPGLVDRERGVVTNAAHVDITVLDLAHELGAALHLPLEVENDVKAAALGVGHVGGTGGARSFAYLNVGTGLAAAVVHNGTLLRGVEGVAGEIGHIPVGGTEICACGQLGCLETVCSGSAMARVWVDAEQHRWNAVEAARQGDAAARATLDMLTDGMSIAVQLLVIAAGAERVVVGGGLTAMGEPFLQAVRENLRARGSRSPFLRSLLLEERVSFLTSAVPLAAIGAAVLSPAINKPE